MKGIKIKQQYINEIINYIELKNSIKKDIENHENKLLERKYRISTNENDVINKLLFEHNDRLTKHYIEI